MKTAYERVIIKTNKNRNRTKKLSEDVTIEIIGDYNPHAKHIVVQDGIVSAVPPEVDKKDDIEISVGDKVYFHHFGTDEDNSVGEDLYWIRYHDIYCKVSEDGEISMINGWNFMEPESVEEKTASGIFLTPAQGDSGEFARITHIHPDLEEQGASIGDRIIFRKDCDYPMIVEGKKYFRIRTKDVIAYEAEGSYSQAI